ncbi:MAG: hypothetical protein WD688_06710 [Candidatus Binatia bacterium]
MTFLVENPWPVIVIAAVVEIGLVVALFVTGRGRLLWAVGGVLVVAAALVLLEWLIATDREQVETQIHAAAAGLAENNVQKVVATFSDSAADLHALAESTMRLIEFREVSVDNQSLKIVVDDRANPPVAAASFRVHAVVGDRAGNIRRLPHTEEVQLRLQKEPGGWRITGYEGSSGRDVLKYLPRGILK